MPYFAVHGSLFLFFFKALLTKVEKLHGHNSKSAATRHCAFLFSKCVSIEIMFVSFVVGTRKFDHVI